MMSAEYLQREYLLRKKKNPKFSMRAFSLLLDIPPGRVSEIFSRKRSITKNMAAKICEKLRFDEEKASEFQHLIDLERVEKDQAKKLGKLLKANPNNEYREIAEEDFCQEEDISAEIHQLLSQWQHYAILNLIKTKDFRSSVPWIASRLGITEDSTREALFTLEKLGLVEFSVNGEIFRTSKNLTTSGEVSQLALKNSHRQDLMKSIECLERVSPKEWDISSITMAIDKKKLGMARELIKLFRRQLSKYLESSEANEVYNLNIQLIPMSKVDNLLH